MWPSSMLKQSPHKATGAPLQEALPLDLSSITHTEAVGDMQLALQAKLAFSMPGASSKLWRRSWSANNCAWPGKLAAGRVEAGASAAQQTSRGRMRSHIAATRAAVLLYCRAFQVPLCDEQWQVGALPCKPIGPKHVGQWNFARLML